MLRKVFLFVAIMATSLTSLFAVGDEAEFKEPKVGDTVPAFVYFDAAAGKDISITSLKGKVVLVNLFATWCGPCRKKLTHLSEDFWPVMSKNDKFEMLTIGREHTVAQMDKFKKETGYDFKFYPDPKREIFSLFAKQSIPRSYVIDQKGKIVYAATGYTEEEYKKMVSIINNLLK